MKKLVFSFAAFLGLGVGAMAQTSTSTPSTAAHNVTVTIPEIALIELVDDANANPTADVIQYTAITDPGAKLSATSLTSGTPLGALRLQYSAVLKSGVTSRKIQVTSVLSGTSTGKGVEITMTAAAGSNGGGAKGTVAGSKMLLSDANAVLTSSDFITGIESCYTGTAAGDGVALTYATALNDASYKDLRSGTYVVAVTYTMVD